MTTSKVAIVTGANKGLGYALVKGLCKQFDGTVYLTSRDGKRGLKSCEELRIFGLNPVFHQLDVTDQESIASFCEHIKQLHGKIDILINNAGVLFLKDAKDTKIHQAEQTVRINFSGLVNFTEKMIPLMKDGGTIVNISSSSGHLSRIPSEHLRRKFSSDRLFLEELKELMEKYVDDVRKGKEVEECWGDSPYVVSKVGVNAYTFLLQRKLENRGIKVNCVHPGYVQSDMTLGAGSLTPEQAAETPLRVALGPQTGGLYVWHDGTIVPWDGEDPRVYIDGKFLIRRRLDTICM